MAVAVNTPCKSCGGKVLLLSVADRNRVLGRCRDCSRNSYYSIDQVPKHLLKKLSGFKEYQKFLSQQKEQKLKDKNGNGPVVLFADDDARNSMYCWDDVLIAPLEKVGIRVEIETDPDRIVSWLTKVDAVILDMTWYGKRIGPDIYKRIKGVVPVIIMSSVWPDPGVGDDYVSKGTFGLSQKVLESLSHLKVI